MRPVPAGGAERIGAELESGIREQLLGRVVRDRRPFEFEEDHPSGDRRRLFLDPLHQRAPFGIGGVHRERQPGVGTGPTQMLLELCDLLHQRREPGCVQ